MPASAATDRLASAVHDATRDPADMTPDQRRREVAAILARGVLRLRRSAESAHGSRPSRTPEKSSNFRPEALDGGQITSLHVFTTPPALHA